MLTMTAHATERLHGRWPGIDQEQAIAQAGRVYERVHATLPIATIVLGTGVSFVIDNSCVLTVLPKRKRMRCYTRGHGRHAHRGTLGHDL